MKGFGLVCASLSGLILLAGCGAQTAPDAAKGNASIKAPAASESDPASAVHKKLRAGAYQLDAGLDSLQEARDAIRSILGGQDGQTKEALLDVIDNLDSAGGTLGEYNAPPELDEIRKDSAAGEKRLRQAIEESNDAVRDLREARGVVADMLESEPPTKEKTALGKADAALEEALDAVSEGIRLFGGTVVPEEEAAAPTTDSEGVAGGR